ncbi:type I polyketide synthase [Herbidospora cretacea]|uniref:type I polyketide synthase n=1 Tax=Herbidospora cretacea TaxID=28444 RepID=UPI000773E5BF|nr:type I polyketide synthase [Herbidospora cretacea]
MSLGDSPSQERVAVVGIACRLPQAPGPAAFWDLLRSERSAITAPPPGRWDEAPDAPLFGGFLDDVDGFDPEFFGISPREAAEMDPQQRLALELAWEALEDARSTRAHPGATTRGAAGGLSTGVFVGAIASDYATLVARGGPAAVTRHTLTGLNRGLIANRVSHALGLRGPSLTVDSAQSSSLVAVHLAAESVRSGESAVAIAAGVHLNLSTDGAVAAGRFGALSPDGRCYTFDSRANGYVRGEGGVALVLKTLTRALADGDRIYALISGGAVNNDGHTAGLTVPDPAAQAEVISLALSRAGLGPEEVQYVELHGTGTKVGDPIEAAALGSALGSGDRVLHVGSVKTNVGHLEGAAGITGLLKTILSVAHRELPASLNYENPNPDIALDELGLRVCTSTGGWPRPDSPLVAGVSSFGMGGTNCHLVVTEPPALPVPEIWGKAPDVLPWVLSGASEQALREQAARLLDHLDGTGAAFEDVAYSLAVTRKAFRHRAVLVGDSAEVRAGVRALAGGGQVAGLVQGVAAPRGRTVFVFPGQGSQWPGMAAALLRESPGFARSIAECAEALDPHTGWSLVDLLTKAGPLERVDVVQPALFAVMVSLARLWEAAGVRPDAVIGHSQGEIAAAHIAGALSLADAAAVSALRARAIAGIAGHGGMASVLLPVEQVAERIARWGERLSVAAVNGPASTVVSGDASAVGELLESYRSEGVRARAVPVDYASHSAQVEPLREPLTGELAGISPVSAPVAFYSTVTGGLLDTAGLAADYWYRNLRQPVEFDRAVRAAVADGHDVVVEASPHPLLTEGVRLVDGDALVTGTLRRDHGGVRNFLLSLGRVHAGGGTVDWPRVIGPARVVDLPTYAFQRRRLWLGSTEVPGPSRELRDLRAAAASAALGLVPEPRDLRAAVASSAAIVLGYASGDQVDPDVTFTDLGFDSAAAVEFQARLASATGLTLPASLVYDHPTVGAVTAYLSGEQPTEDEAVPVAAGEPVAIVAMSGRWPGGARSPEELWEILGSGSDVISEFPVNRGWDLAGLRTGSATDSGGFLHDADEFDAAFFGLSPREATVIDPQQRILLESAWELYERAGLDPSAQRGTRTGVYVGVTPHDYGPRLHEIPDDHQGHALTGTLTSAASGRIAYTLGLEGPALTVDTACSSSLVAIHLAVEALRRGECDLAVAGGAAVMSNPGMFTEFSRQGGLAPDGRIKAFAKAADGTAWAEGAGLVLLEPLSAARRNGHPVLAVVRGSAVNQDGASNGFTAPSGPAQQRVIRAALAVAGLSPDEVDAVEAHGTGTTLGDPIEAGAILATYGRDRERPVLLGSSKAHLGHTQAAAGVTGLVSMVQAIRSGTLPPTLHIDEPSPHVDWTSGRVGLLTEPTPWPETGRPRRAAVSSFGISGTNAHLIVEQAPDDVAEPVTSPEVVPLTLSAKSEAALREQAGLLRERLAGRPDITVADAARTLITGRALLTHRAVVLDDHLDALNALAAGDDHPAVVSGVATRRGGLAFLLTGQGSQRAGMGRELAGAFPVFADALAEVAGHLDAHLGHPIRDVMFTGGDGLLDTTAYTQPALFAFEVALHELAVSFGLRPTHLIGHSIGELTAAHLAGVLSLPDAAALVTARGRLMQSVTETGAMAALRATESELAGLLGDGVDVAAVNGPDSLVVSGDRDAVGALVARWRAERRQAKELQVSHAFHSPHMDAVVAGFREIAAGVSYHPPRIPVISNVTGRLATPEQLTDPGYWAGHIRRAVRFHDGITTLRDLGVTDFVEIGPGGALTSLVEEGAVAAARGGRPEPDAFRAALATLHTTGVPVDWRPGEAGPHTPADLPTYPFQRRRFWLTGPARQTLSGVVELADGSGAVLTGRLPEATEAAFADLAERAAQEIGGLRLAELTVEGPVVAGAVDVQILVAAGEGRRAIGVHVRPAGSGSWTRHATGAFEPVEEAAPATPPEELGDLLDLVRRTGAAVLGHADVEAVPPDRGFLDGEFDSLSSVELRNRLDRITGLRLPSTVVFDHPTPLALAAYLRERLFPAEPEAAPEPDLDLELGLDLDSATNDELFELIDNELRLS